VNPKSVPIETTLESLREVAHETARRLGKKVRLHFAGDAPDWAGPELSLVQEALVQTIRNAIDHGIESPETREKAGKPPVGEISIAFTEEAGHVVVRVRDDGVGVDSRAVARRATQLGLVDAGHTLAPNEALDLLFEPGFSTRDSVSEVSGRGIGLDVVRENIESLDGNVEIDTTRGAGTTVTLRIPRKTAAEAA
jgi:two-component system chemotaxis sensor kinase CheA